MDVAKGGVVVPKTDTSQDAAGPSLGLINAIEKGDKEVVEEALRAGADVNVTVGAARNTPLHMAIRNRREEIAALLLGHNADVHIVNKLGRTPLHEAARVGSLRVVKQLLPQGAYVNAVDHERWTPLHYAAEKGHTKVVDCLIAHFADVNARNMDENTPLHIAALYAHEIVAELLIDRGSNAVCYNNDNKSPVKIMTEKYFDSRFFFRAISLQDDAEILAQMTSPIRFVNQIFKEPKGELSMLGSEVYSMLKGQDPRVLRYLLVWYNSLKKAAERHGHEKIDLFSCAEQIEAAVNEIFACDSMDDPRSVQRVLQPDNALLQNTSQRDGFEGHSLLERRELFRCQVTSFSDTGVLSLCLNHNCKFIFGRQQISGFIAGVFRAPARAVLYKKQPAAGTVTPPDANDRSTMPQQVVGAKDEYSAQIPFVSRIEEYFHFNIFDPQRFGLSYSLRSCPVAMFGMELISKAVTLGVLSYVAVGDYGRKYGLDYHLGDYSDDPLSSSETVLVFMLFANMTYELGQLAEEGWSVSSYLKDEWNIVDTMCMGMLITWFVTRVIIGEPAIARVVLALVAIPLSAGSLRYLTVSKTLGVIVATTRAMFSDLVAFLAVYVVCILGFGIFFMAMFYGNDSFYSVPQTMSQMFQYTLANFDFAAFDSTSAAVNALAQVVLAIYLTLTAILLLNLLIARMSNAYQRVDDQAIQEWSFAKTQTVLQYLLLKERHVFCMLPAPFNLISAATYPIHYLLLDRTGVSVAGTVSNFVMAYIGGPIRVYALFYCFRTGMKAILTRAYNRNKTRPILAVLLLVFIFLFCSAVAVYLTIHVVVFYPMFAWGDLVERVDTKTHTLSYIRGADTDDQLATEEESVRESEVTPAELGSAAGARRSLELTLNPLRCDEVRPSEVDPHPSSTPAEFSEALFTKDDINRILTAMGSKNIDKIQYGIDGDNTGAELLEMKSHLEIIRQRLDSVIEENRSLKQLLGGIADLLRK